MKFTPGPWVYEKRLKDIKTVYGKLGMDTSELIPVILLGGGKNTDANGFLISAAPLLYAELKALIYLLEPLANAGGLTQSWIDALNRAKAALKKAEGE